MLYTQGGYFTCQRPNKQNPLFRRAGDIIVVLMIRHSVYGGVLFFHKFKLPIFISKINRIFPVAGSENFENLGTLCYFLYLHL